MHVELNDTGCRIKSGMTVAEDIDVANQQTLSRTSIQNDMHAMIRAFSKLAGEGRTKSRLHHRDGTEKVCNAIEHLLYVGAALAANV